MGVPIKSIGGNPIVIGMDGFDEDVLDTLDLKADIDGYYAQLTAGAADNLTSRGDAVAAEYLYRTSGGTADIETGQATIKSIKGNTLVWNQLCDRAWTGSTKGRVTTSDSDGTMTVTTTSDSSLKYVDFIVTAGHTYLIKGDYTTSGEPVAYGTYDANNNYDKRVYLSGEVSTVQHVADLLTTTSTYNHVRVVNFGTAAASGASCTVKNLMLFDLTTMFGSGNEPSTVAEFEALYGNPYYAYDPGSLLSVNMTGIETKGFNQQPYVTTNTGYVFSPNNAVRTIAGQEYEFVMAAVDNPSWTISFRLYELDGTQIKESDLDSIMTVKNKASYNFYLKSSDVYSEGGSHTNKKVVFTPLKNMYIMFFVSQPVTDPCLHLVWSGRRDGEYEQFWSAQRLIAAGTLRRAGSVYDEQTETERIVRVGVVDLGTLTWTASGTVTGGFYTDSVTDVKGIANATDANNATCSKYAAVKGNLVTTTDKTICAGYNNNNRIYVKDETYAGQTGTSFATAMNGVYLFYELATPTITPIDPPLNLSYRVDDWGTERVMVPSGEQSAPPVMEVAYGLNVVDFVRRAPSEYISAASFAQYLLARDAHDGTTTTMEWDDTNRRYEFTITDTVTEG